MTSLFELLPAVHRLRDAAIAGTIPAEQGPLEAFLAAVAEQVAVLDESIEQLYDDQFIETCAPWVTPYIGDLIGYRPLHGRAPGLGSRRAEVAHTIALRRRKGTLGAIKLSATSFTLAPNAEQKVDVSLTATPAGGPRRSTSPSSMAFRAGASAPGSACRRTRRSS